MRAQVSKLATAASAAAMAQQAAASSSPGAPGVGQPGQAEGEQVEELAVDEGALNEGDDIMVDPLHLKDILPDFDWESLERKEPLAIRALLEKDGIPITNVSQLADYGITNFVIRRAIPPPDAPDAPSRQ